MTVEPFTVPVVITSFLFPWPRDLTCKPITGIPELKSVDSELLIRNYITVGHLQEAMGHGTEEIVTKSYKPSLPK